ncbi:VOC family protein [Rhodophyticola sp.]|uniref:VOC family protein n=1 Tax=Rhodophyticola sp. TaxID=2680032 RepID=UPI003D28CF59
MPRLATITLLVPDYDAGLAFFVGGLGWTCTADEDQGRKRWVTVSADPEGGAALLLSEATTPLQTRTIGAQTGDRVAFFLETDDFGRDAARITAAGGTFLEAPRTEPYGTVAQWRDPFGNLWDLLQPAG